MASYILEDVEALHIASPCEAGTSRKGVDHRHQHVCIRNNFSVSGPVAFKIVRGGSFDHMPANHALG